ncbi:hypothetical protein C8Q78DRAFT_1081152 [Trametes maxima]|nr:hypothetical protein C8Q78DRAFT_1081152 [Trametes maxima]
MSRSESPPNDLVYPAMVTDSPASTPTLISRSSTMSDAVTIVGDEQTKVKRVRPFRAASIALDMASARFDMYRTKSRRSGKQKGNEDPVLALNTQVTSVAELVSPLSSGVQGSAQKIAQYGMNALVDGLPELLKVLENVASVHPFIALAVGAFRVAIELDLKRRENDKKINLLFLEMRDMMTALVELQNIEDPGHIGKDGKTVQERLKALVDQIEVDVLECANACDAYAKKALAAKVFGGLKWDEKLHQYVKRFTKRRSDIELALAVHLGINIDIANRKLDTLDIKMDLVLDYLHRCTSPEEKEMSAFVQARGGQDAVLRNERFLLELSRRPSVSSPPGTDARWGGRQKTLDLHEFRAELSEDPEISIARNRDAFERKFEMQERELSRIQEIVHEENELVITSLSAGPHDKIRDNDIHNIWREMRWRGNVKARHFVLALRDYCLERLDKMKKNEQTFVDCDRPTKISEHDEWTLEYISVTRLQAIIEAFDDDASGFITVGEVNAFTASKPPQWSLLHWMAYWAVGWQMTMTDYAAKIDNILGKMFAVKSHVLPANRRSVDQYLDSVWSPITELTTGFRRAERNDVLEERFESYVTSEENRLRDALAGVRYDIDAADTLQLVTGPGRIEKYLFPLLYLLLERDFKIMRLAGTVVLHRDELWDSTDTLKWVFRAVEDRYTNLENLFKQQNLDPGQQFKVFGSELFRYCHDSTHLWSTERLREAHYPDQPYNDAHEEPIVDVGRVLNHYIGDISSPLAVERFNETLDDRCATEPLKSILGQWSGFLGNDEVFPNEPMLTLNFHASPASPNVFVASGTASSGTRFTVIGTTVVDGSNALVYSFTLNYKARHEPKVFAGRLVDDGREFNGKWTSKSNDGSFLFRRLPPDSMRLWPLPADAPLTKPQTLWRFALSAVLDEVRREMLSLRLLAERQTTRQQYLRIIRAGISPRSGDEGERQLQMRCYRRMTPMEARYYYTVFESMRRIAPKHFGISCANCRGDVYGSRVMCLDCGIKTTVDLCDKPDCREATVGPDRRDDLVSPHLPTHRILKVRRVIHRHREFGKTYRAAQAALIRAEEALADADDLEAAHSPHDHSRTHSHSHSHSLSHSHECFICSDCESKKTTFSGGHKPTHGLVRCGTPREDAKARLEDLEWSHTRIDTLENKIDELRKDSATRLDAIDSGLSTLTHRSSQLENRLTAFDVRLQRIEDLLALLASRI